MLELCSELLNLNDEVIMDLSTKLSVGLNAATVEDINEGGVMTTLTVHTTHPSAEYKEIGSSVVNLNSKGVIKYGCSTEKTVKCYHEHQLPKEHMSVEDDEYDVDVLVENWTAEELVIVDVMNMITSFGMKDISILGDRELLLTTNASVQGSTIMLTVVVFVKNILH